MIWCVIFMVDVVRFKFQSFITNKYSKIKKNQQNYKQKYHYSHQITLYFFSLYSLKLKA